MTIPAQSLAIIRSWNTVTLLAKNGAFGAGEIEAIREFARSRSFDTAYFPGIRAADANRYNLLDEDWLYDGIDAFLGGDAAAYYEDYKFHIEPATDDRPYFFHFFKWRTVPEVLALRGVGGEGLIEWPYLVVVGTLAQAVVAGALLILLPLSRIRRTWTGGARIRRLLPAPGPRVPVRGDRVHPEVRPVPEPSAVFRRGRARGFPPVRRPGQRRFLPARLACGSERLCAGERGRRRHRRDCSYAISSCCRRFFGELAGLADATKILLSVALIAPLAFFMGMPFPLGLRRVAASAPGFLPWAWGINGFASVLSAVLATLLAIHFGFAVVIAIAILLYAGAATLRVA